MAGRFDGKVVAISGAAIGQGRNHAIRFAAEGACLVLFDVCSPIPEASHEIGTEHDLDRTAESCRVLGANVLTQKVDVRVWEDVRSVFDAAMQQFGRIDTVVSNAGVTSVGPKVWDIEEDTFRAVVDVNLVGSWHVLKAAAGHMRIGDGAGSIVLIGSGASLKGLPNVGAYVAAKHALVGLMRSSARELASDGIRVNLVAPGNVKTSMLLNEGMFRVFAPDLDQPNELDFVERARSVSPMGIPFVDCDDITEAVMFLSSDTARYITGAVLPVDGGSAIP
ncbi:MULTISPECIES: mycofactocin-coupled SDR family oxidoreductase [Rhodococcus]|uniref:Mycofactocin-coupled SDR family oxidoreductase n=1 Tax=Rhodococcus oxybenzonivorans TaxID=1990687 RepID=A0AAE5A714_9NOCA|nr:MULTISPECIES: mycofactocin-coupled SDR family oxidoreductase [Rhodococcus]MDV7240557.1 mycofactocin-coupled SDR family oxidoreductase [Rhodococcus oxybenzonivorans]MDV7265748.1 mycofactocin-coupled SDR family oxidoreductase [Rhodococcus oxybenzonivorans]MDV7272830.1 mycofactocin-coupled SDR family oxidoreductase [Rhodococcus oxybenzonivorans]MDV7333431.1 mycofactocin-coupled SDR family oxidoreductase [Rhodococcus oxybenzonivorans]MDV7342598.1 mycofactocin-coupled SDR family oxidoreductase [